jgi:hypothetical protein
VTLPSIALLWTIVTEALSHIVDKPFALLLRY